MKMNVIVTLKNENVYSGVNLTKEKVTEAIELIERLANDNSIESVVITKTIFTKETKEKYIDAFEEAVVSIRSFFSEENKENTTEEAVSFFGAEMLKLKLEQEKEGRNSDCEWLGRKIDRLEDALIKMEEDRGMLFNRSAELEEVASNLKREKESLEELHKSMEEAYILNTIAKQKRFEKNYNALLSELNSLKKRTLWQRIRNIH